MKNIKKFDQFINEDKKENIRTRDNGLSFTVIKINKISDDVWSAKFNYTYNNGRMFETEYKGSSEFNLIKKIEEFFETKLEEDDYIIEDY
jgi:hypothetical protein